MLDFLVTAGQLFIRMVISLYGRFRVQRRRKSRRRVRRYVSGRSSSALSFSEVSYHSRRIRVPLRRVLFRRSRDRNNSSDPKRTFSEHRRRSASAFVLSDRKPSQSWFDKLRDGRGLALPGQNYAGPLNSNFDLPATNRLDRAARIHDYWYGKLGKKSYSKYNRADQHFLKSKAVANPRTPNEWIAKVYFTAKKYLAPRDDSLKDEL